MSAVGSPFSSRRSARRPGAMRPRSVRLQARLDQQLEVAVDAEAVGRHVRAREDRNPGLVQTADVVLGDLDVLRRDVAGDRRREQEVDLLLGDPGCQVRVRDQGGVPLGRDERLFRVQGAHHENPLLHRQLNEAGLHGLIQEDVDQAVHAVEEEVVGMALLGDVGHGQLAMAVDRGCQGLHGRAAEHRQLEVEPGVLIFHHDLEVVRAFGHARVHERFRLFRARQGRLFDLLREEVRISLRQGGRADGAEEISAVRSPVALLLAAHAGGEMRQGPHVHLGRDAELEGPLQLLARAGMRVGIDDAGHQRRTRGIDHRDARGRNDVRAHGVDPAVDHDHRGRRDHLRAVEHPGVGEGERV
jgi:hypothetical protein